MVLTVSCCINYLDILRFERLHYSHIPKERKIFYQSHIINFWYPLFWKQIFVTYAFILNPLHWTIKFDIAYGSSSLIIIKCITWHKIF